jgi:hypothetical protein
MQARKGGVEDLGRSAQYMYVWDSSSSIEVVGVVVPNT